MKDITFRVDDELHEELQDIAEQEGESVSMIVRRAVRKLVQGQRPDVRQSASVHEGTGRVR